MKKKIALAITFLTGGLLVIPVLAHNGADGVLAAYEKVSLALAQDDLATAKSAAATRYNNCFPF